MGLFSKLRSRLGMLRTRATSLSARLVSRLPPRTRRVLGRVGRSRTFRVGARVGRVAFRVGRLGSPVGLALTALSVGGLVAGIRRRRKARKGIVSPGTAVSGAVVSKRLGLAKFGLIAAGLGAAAFVGEQIAEKLGVRGGAGFVGRRPRKPVTGRRRRRRKKVIKIPRRKFRIETRRVAVRRERPLRRRRGQRKRRGGKRVSFTTKTGQKVSFTTKR